MFPPKKILYPINLDSKNIIILNRAFAMSRKINCHIDILYVNDSQAGYRHSRKTEVDVKKAVVDNTKEGLLDGMDINYHVAQGELAAEVKKFVETNNTDLIITGHKHHNKLFTSIFDTPEESIIDVVMVPVMVIPRSVAEEELDITELDL